MEKKRLRHCLEHNDGILGYCSQCAEIIDCLLIQQSIHVTLLFRCLAAGAVTESGTAESNEATVLNSCVGSVTFTCTQVHRNDTENKYICL